MSDKKERREIDFNAVLRDGGGEPIRFTSPHKLRLGTVAGSGIASTIDKGMEQEEVVRLNSLTRAIVNQDAIGQPVEESVSFNVLTLPAKVVKLIDEAVFRYAQRVEVSVIYDAAHGILYPDEAPATFDDIDVRTPELAEVEREDAKSKAAEPAAVDTEDSAAE